MRRSIIISILSICVILLFIAGLLLGSADISINDVIKGLSGNADKSINYIVGQVRLPRTLTALISGMALAVSGLMMQTLFSNPLAGPFILGISSGASLFVAFITIIGGTVLGGLGLPTAAMVGALISAFIILSASTVIRNPFVLLIVGVMFSGFASSLVGILQYFADPGSLKTYVIWSLGDFGMVQTGQIPTFASITLLGITAAIFCIKPLNAYLLGESYVSSMGLSMRLSRVAILIISAVLAGTVTAYCGPIVFIGLAVPNIVRFMIKSANHLVMMPITIIAGGGVGLVCDIISRLPGAEMNLPINAISSLIGAPVVIAVLLRNRNAQYS